MARRARLSSLVKKTWRARTTPSLSSSQSKPTATVPSSARPGRFWRANRKPAELGVTVFSPPVEPAREVNQQLLVVPDVRHQEEQEVNQSQNSNKTEPESKSALHVAPVETAPHASWLRCGHLLAAAKRTHLQARIHLTITLRADPLEHDGYSP